VLPHVLDVYFVVGVTKLVLYDVVALARVQFPEVISDAVVGILEVSAERCVARTCRLSSRRIVALACHTHTTEAWMLWADKDPVNHSAIVNQGHSK